MEASRSINIYHLYFFHFRSASVWSEDDLQWKAAEHRGWVAGEDDSGGEKNLDRKNLSRREKTYRGQKKTYLGTHLKSDLRVGLLIQLITRSGWFEDREQSDAAGKEIRPCAGGRIQATLILHFLIFFIVFNLTLQEGGIPDSFLVSIFL